MKQAIIQRLIGLLIITFSSTAFADSGTRNQEIAQCTEAELVTWGDGQDRPAGAASLIFFYKHSGAPPWFQEQQVMNLLTRASAEWSK